MVHYGKLRKQEVSEKKVILEEELLTSRESPEGALDISLYSTAFNTHPSQLPRISIGFRVPAADRQASSALSLFSIYLASGRSSRFEKLLVKPGLVLDVAASTNTLIQTGLYTIHTVLPPEVSPDEVEKLIFSELERVSAEGISSSLIHRLKKRRTAWSTISDADPQSRSRRLSTGQARFNDPLHFWHSIINTEKVTNDEIKAAVSRYLVKDNATIARLKPMGTVSGYNTQKVPAESVKPDLIPPSSLKPSDIDIPDKLVRAPSVSVADNTREIILENNLRIILKKDS